MTGLFKLNSRLGAVNPKSMESPDAKFLLDDGSFSFHKCLLAEKSTFFDVYFNQLYQNRNEYR